MKMNTETIQKLLDSIYDNVLTGLPGAETVYELADEYLKDNGHNPELAANSLIKWQMGKCGISGFLSGLGGLITLPLAIPADLAATWYVQMRMAAAIAHMNGYDVKSDQVKTFVYACLVGDGIKDLLKGSGVVIGKQLTKQAIKAISREMVVKVNRAVGFRLVTKFGERGAVNLVKMVPVAGGIVSAGFNTYYCLKVGDAAVFCFEDKSQAA